jgi:hypothetical protein
MGSRRSFFQMTLSGALASLLPLKWQNLTRPSEAANLTPYSIQIVYVSTVAVTQEMLYVENPMQINAINKSYVNAGRLLSINSYMEDGNFFNEYFFDNEASYLNWEMEMVLAKVVDRNLCRDIVTYEGKLRYVKPDDNRFNKQIIIHVSQHA